jgi:phenylalanine-4-hydroxylase
VPERQPFDPVSPAHPYRIDVLQPVYFVIGSFDQLFDLAQSDGVYKRAQRSVHA